MGLGLSPERTERLRELAAEGVELHSEGQPEREVCDGLLLALVEIQWLRAELLREHADHKETLADVDSLVAAERERCAKVCEQYAWLQEEGSPARSNFRNCAATIRGA